MKILLILLIKDYLLIIVVTCIKMLCIFVKKQNKFLNSIKLKRGETNYIFHIHTWVNTNNCFIKFIFSLYNSFISFSFYFCETPIQQSLNMCIGCNERLVWGYEGRSRLIINSLLQVTEIPFICVLNLVLLLVPTADFITMFVLFKLTFFHGFIFVRRNKCFTLLSF